MESLSFLRIDLPSWVTAAHVVAVTLGLGGALAADLLVLNRAVFRPITAFTVEALEALSRFVVWGLIAVWATGAALTWLRFGGGVAPSPKFFAKIAIVVVLTVNAIFVHGIVLPAVAKRVGSRLFAGADLRRCAGFALVGAASSTSWLAPVVLGIARELGPRASFEEVMLAYGACVVLAFAGITALSYGSALLLRAGTRFPAGAPDLTPQEAMTWARTTLTFRRARGRRSVPAQRSAA